MTNRDNPKQLTVCQLIHALSQCDRADIVKFFNTDSVSLNDVAFVERYATGKTVYLHSEKVDFSNFSSPAGLDNNADPVIEIIRSDKDFAETIWINFIKIDKATKIMYACVNFDDIRVYDNKKDIFEDLWWINGFMMPNGEFRLGVGDAAILLGYGRDDRSKAFKSFENLGAFQHISSPRSLQTMSLSCFTALIIIEAESLGNKSAALIRPDFTLEKLTSIFQNAFNLKKTIIQPTDNTIENLVYADKLYGRFDYHQQRQSH